MIIAPSLKTIAISWSQASSSLTTLLGLCPPRWLLKSAPVLRILTWQTERSLEMLLHAVLESFQAGQRFADFTANDTSCIPSLQMKWVLITSLTSFHVNYIFSFREKIKFINITPQSRESDVVPFICCPFNLSWFLQISSKEPRAVLNVFLHLDIFNAHTSQSRISIFSDLRLLYLCS